VTASCQVIFNEHDDIVEIRGSLPKRNGVKVHRKILPSEMVFLSEKYRVEFGLAQKRRLAGWQPDLITPIWQEGEYWLFSGTETDPTGVSIPYQSDSDEYWYNIYHTHLNGKTTPSGSDMIDLATRWWQDTSGIIAIGMQSTQVFVFDKDTSPFDI
jgi:hypothetical protein